MLRSSVPDQSSALDHSAETGEPCAETETEASSVSALSTSQCLVLAPILVLYALTQSAAREPPDSQIGARVTLDLKQAFFYRRGEAQ